MPWFCVRDGYVAVENLPVAFHVSVDFTSVEHRADNENVIVLYHCVCPYINLSRSAPLHLRE